MMVFLLKNSATGKKGMTVIELVMVIGIIGVVSLLTTTSLVGKRGQTDLTNTAQQITSLLREARARSVSQTSSTSWGVHFENSTTTPFYALFYSSNYGSSTVIGHYKLPQTVAYDSSSISPGSSTNITFSQISGNASASTSVRIYLVKSGVFDSFTIGVASSGAVSYLSLAPAIANIYVSNITPSAAKVVWDTDQNADSKVNYGLTSSYGLSSSDSSQVRSHTINLTSLSSSTTYHYQVQSVNSGGTSTSSNATFTTTAVVQTDFVAPTPNPMTWASAPAAVSSSSVSMTATTATDASSSPTNYFFTYASCAQDVGTGGASSAWQSSSSYANSGLQVNKCYGYTVKARDSAEPTPNETSPSATPNVYTLANVPGAPTLSGIASSSMTLTNDPNNNPTSSPSTSFAVIASTTDSAWNGFWVNSAGTGTSTSEVWMSNSQLTSFVISGLKPSTTYYFKVEAQNVDGVKTALGPASSGTTTQTDTTAPTPNPETWASAPSAASTSSISMTATTATDALSPPVNYLFTYASCSQDNGTGGASSSWQSSSSYANSGLQVNKCYGYTVKAEDSATPAVNIGSPSTPTSTVYTIANVPGTATLSNVASSSLTFTNAPNGNPTSSPSTSFALFVSSTTDSRWNGFWVNSAGNGTSTVEVWMSNTQLTNFVISDLSNSTTYYFKVEAQNVDGVKTALGPASSGTTTQTDTTAPTPNPETWASAPSAASTSSISMTATTATDALSPPVNYLFTYASCSQDNGTGGASSSWQSSSSYANSGLQVNKCYGYTVKAEDSATPAVNIGSPSTPTSTVYTIANVPGTATLSNVASSSLTFTNAPNGNPTSSPSTSFALFVSSTTDSRWNGFWVNSAGSGTSTVEVWMSNTQLTNFVVSNLATSTTYYFKVEAQNVDGIKTSLSSASPKTTGPFADTILAWENPASIPSGWTCLDCSAGSDFYGAFPRASSTYGNATSGADTVSHAATFVSAANGASAGQNWPAGSSFPVSTHTHTWGNFTTATGDIRPPYKNLVFIKANNPSQIPNGAIGIFDTSSSSMPANWTYYSALEGNYLRGGENTTSTGGSATHQHTISSTVTSGAASASTLAAGTTNPNTAHAANVHTHTLAAGGVAATATSSDPLYISVVFGQLTTTSSPPANLIAMFNNAGSLPPGWSSVSTSGSAYSDRLLKGAQTFGATGGRLTHNHGNTAITSTADTGGSNNRLGAGSAGAASAHTHSVTYSNDTQNSMPVNRYVILGKYSGAGAMLTPEKQFAAIPPENRKNTLLAALPALGLVLGAYSENQNFLWGVILIIGVASVVILYRKRKKKGIVIQ
ncbi:MAG: fibronectin type III domain-containing protein [Patescibacteria group bacterium]